jgi:hypothetical protein
VYSSQGIRVAFYDDENGENPITYYWSDIISSREKF